MEQEQQQHSRNGTPPRLPTVVFSQRPEAKTQVNLLTPPYTPAQGYFNTHDSYNNSDTSSQWLQADDLFGPIPTGQALSSLATPNDTSSSDLLTDNDVFDEMDAFFAPAQSSTLCSTPEDFVLF
ncbi:hypothetical protein DM01DRAFT_1333323 [Hesseltinella vesiculosa]|uniref:Uncharacterized protein n=1 Tax=Hesseltinella vesiculosa TaxID=101127 RepID=A0A1X2GPI2_9FUNG|nr:hypothetical protein DM01DRAFT_1333323 [Hesseltinella vesiculosa]